MWTGSRARFANDIYNPVFPPVYRTPNRTWPKNAWETALNGETLGHFRPERVAVFASLFAERRGKVQLLRLGSLKRRNLVE